MRTRLQAGTCRARRVPLPVAQVVCLGRGTCLVPPSAERHIGTRGAKNAALGDSLQACSALCKKARCPAHPGTRVPQPPHFSGAPAPGVDLQQREPSDRAKDGAAECEAHTANHRLLAGMSTWPLSGRNTAVASQEASQEQPTKRNWVKTVSPEVLSSWNEYQMFNSAWVTQERSKDMPLTAWVSGNLACMRVPTCSRAWRQSCLQVLLVSQRSLHTSARGPCQRHVHTCRIPGLQ